MSDLTPEECARTSHLNVQRIRELAFDLRYDVPSAFRTVVITLVDAYEQIVKRLEQSEFSYAELTKAILLDRDKWKHREHKKLLDELSDLKADRDRLTAEVDRLSRNQYTLMWGIVDTLNLGAGGCPDSLIIEEVTGLREKNVVLTAQVQALEAERSKEA